MANTTMYQGVEKMPTTFSFDDGLAVTGTMAVSGAATFDSQSQSPRVNVLAQVAGYTSGTVLTDQKRFLVVYQKVTVTT